MTAPEAATPYLADKESRIFGLAVTGSPFQVIALSIVLLAGIRLVAFVILAVTLSHLRQAKDRLEHRHNQLREALARVEAMTAEAERLRKQLHTVCAWTKRIKDEGKWVSFEQFLSKHYGLQFTHGISEEARRDLKVQLADPPEPLQTSSPAPDRDALPLHNIQSNSSL